MEKDVRTLRIRLRSACIRLGIAVAVVMASTTLAAVVGQASASATTLPYLVTVYANTFYGQPPTFQTRISPSLPTGASLSGNVSCTMVSSSANVLEPISGSGSGLGLDAGVYNIIPNDCTSTLSLVGAQGSIQLLGGPLVISPDPTRMVGAAEEFPSATNPEVAISVAIEDVTLDGSTLEGLPVNFSYENADGLNFQAPGCSSVPTAIPQVGSNQAQSYYATAVCELTGSAAQAFISGTGTWFASYGGSTDYVGASFALQLPGDTTTAQAAINLNTELSSDQIHVVPDTTPPSNCHPGGAGVGLIGVSLSQLSCSQIQVLQILTGVIPAVVSGGAAAEAAIAEEVGTVSVDVVAGLEGRAIPEVLDVAVSSSEDVIDETINLRSLPLPPN
ncbi:MAG: hypothetical protein ACP5O0_04285 [Acidimicrobiales bacterium]